MSVYAIVEIEVTDPELYELYRQRVPPIVARYGGEYLVRGGAVTVQEGDWEPKRVVVLRFPDRSAAQAFFDGPDYAPVKAIRFQSARSRTIIVDGVD